MKLHWSPRSPFVRKVMVVAHEVGLAEGMERVRSMAAMTVPNAAIMADNPLSKIPTLVLDDGTVLADSTVIMEYLDAVGGGGLRASGGAARWETLTRQALGNGLLDMLVLWRNERDKPAGQQGAALLEAFGVKTAATLDRFERMAPGWGARGFDLGDVAVGCALGYADFRFAALGWREGRGALAEWYAGFAARPSAVATAFVDG